MKKTFRTITIGYILFLGAVLGAGLFAGIVVAPVTFHTDLWLGSDVLTRFQEGQIMTENFFRLSYLVEVAVLFVVLYEGYKFKNFERDSIGLVATFLVIATGLLFAQYYIPDIILMQNEGVEATQSEAFLNTHKGSEINFKIFSFALLVLLVQNMRKVLK